MTSPARNPNCRALAILGTGSDVGKSVLVTGLCRWFARRGVQVAPYKAQNMSNNSYVTLSGGEIGRAQVVQAHAAGVEPTVDMNPVLLKPSTDVQAQVIVQGHVLGNAEAREYFRNTDALFGKALESYARLSQDRQLIVLEGAGSCAEVNLRPRDFVNFRMAQAVNAPVVLAADIDRGGVFAQIVGTLDVIPPEDRACVKGILINRFRGDAALFDDGMTWLEQRTGLPVLGLVPYFRHIEIDSEDGMPLDVVLDPPEAPKPGRINIAVVRLPHISNFTDFNPLARQTCVRLHYLARPRLLTDYDLVLLPGSKNVRADRQWLRDVGWDAPLRKYVDAGGQLGGVCGGYQLLGQTIADPHGVEGAPGSAEGLGLLPLHTTLEKHKTLTRTVGHWPALDQVVDGYEIHMGVTRMLENLTPLLQVTARNQAAVSDTDGAQRADGKVWGTYLHGLFDQPGIVAALLHQLNAQLAPAPTGSEGERTRAFQERQYDLLADHIDEHVDMARLQAIITGDPVTPGRIGC